MEAAGRQADQDVAVADRLRIEQSVARDAADEESREVVGTGRIHAGHLGGLPAEQRTAMGAAGVGHRADDAREDLRLQRGGGEVVEEEQRLRAHRERIVHAEMHEVGTDALVPIEHARELDLRADPVRRRDEDRVRAGELEEPAERADVADDLGPVRRPDLFADAREGSSSCTGTR